MAPNRASREDLPEKASGIVCEVKFIEPGAFSGTRFLGRDPDRLPAPRPRKQGQRAPFPALGAGKRSRSRPRKRVPEKAPGSINLTSQTIPEAFSGRSSVEALLGGISCTHPRDSNGFQLVPAGSSWFQRVPAGSRWFQWVPANSSGFERVPAGSSRFQRLPAGSNGFQ